MKNSLIYFACLSTFSSFIPFSAVANAATNPSNSSATDVTVDQNRLEELIVSANLYETRVFDVMGTSSVVNQSDIQRFQPANLGEIFEQQSGLDIVRNGGRASNTSLFTRGTNSSHTLLLINGQRFSSASLGLTQFNFIDPEQIDRVEMVRGSRSALYGSDAIGGVIQIFTKRSSETPERFINFEAGSHATHRVGGGASDTLGAYSYSGSISYEKSDSIDSLVDDTSTNSDKDGYKNLNANLFSAYQISDKHELSYFYWQSRSKADFDSAWSSDVYPESENLQSAGGLQVDLGISEFYRSKLSFGHSRDDSEIIPSSSLFKTKRETFYWQNDIQVSPNVLVNTGFDYEQTRISGNTVYLEDSREVDSREVLAGFLQLNAKTDIFEVQAGSRYDNNSAYGNTTNHSFSSAFNFTDSLRTFISWNEGFRAPTFNDLFYPNLGNPDLLPEQSENLEWGLKAQHNAVSFQFALFRNSIKNLIDWAPIDEQGMDWRPQNIAEADIRGAEIIVSVPFEHWSVDAGLHHIDPKDGATGRPLVNRAKKKFTLDVHRAWQSFTLGLIFNAQSTRYSSYDEFTDSQATLPGYAMLDAYASWDISKQLGLKLKLNNILDKDYQLNPIYNEDGFNGSIKLNYAF